MTNDVTNMTDEVTNMADEVTNMTNEVTNMADEVTDIAEEEPEEEIVEEIEEEEVEEEVEETTHSNSKSYLSALLLLVVGGALTFAPMLIEQYGLLENINLPEGGQMQIIGTEQMIEMLSTIFPIIGCMMVILAVCKVVTALNPYRYC